MLQVSFVHCTPFVRSRFYSKRNDFKRRKGIIFSPTTASLPRVPIVAAFDTSSASASFIGRKAVGVDYGMNRVGIAVSVGFSPRPLTCIKHENDNDLVLSKLSEVVLSERAEIIVIGLPLSARVEYSSTQTQVARNFAQLVANRFWKQEVYLCDEKYTSIVANERLAQRGVNLLSAKELVDSEAAVVLLERFFGGWSNDKSGVYLKLVTRQQDNTREGVDHVEEQQPDHEEKTTYRPYREWRRKLLRQQN